MDLGEGPLCRELPDIMATVKSAPKSSSSLWNSIRIASGIDIHCHRNSLQSSAGLELDLARSVP
jgi:hypothetical protein